MMAFSVLALGDPHFKVKNLQVMSVYEERVLETIEKYRPSLVVILGDTLDSHSQINVYPLCAAIRFVKKIAATTPVFLLIGNHDRPNNSDFQSDLHPFTALEGAPNVEIFPTARRVSLLGKTFVGVPYVPPGRFAEALEGLQLDDVDLIFAHQEFKGAWMGQIRSTEGDTWDIDGPPIISGHIHSYQRLQTNLLYVGTALQHSFGENLDKTISLFVEDPNGSFCGYQETRLKLGLPRKQKFRVKCSEVNKLKITNEMTGSRIIVVGSPEEIHAISRKVIIDRWRTKGISVHFEEIVPEKSPIEAPQRIDFLSSLHETIKDHEIALAHFQRLLR